MEGTPEATFENGLLRTIGVEGPGDRMFPLFKKATPLPAIKTVNYKTAYHNQDSIKFKLFQGEDDMASANQLLGKYVCNGIPPAPAGKGRVAVVYRVSEDGVLTVMGTPVGSQRPEVMTFDLKSQEEKWMQRYSVNSSTKAQK